MIAARTVEEVSRALREPGSDLQLLDVREPEERAIAAIEPSLHIAMQEIPGRLAEIPKDRPIVVYCHHGTRSAMVAAYLVQQGFPDVSNLTGGIDAWSQRIDRSLPRY
jgi:rhodanese-related sulfurtransferase